MTFAVTFEDCSECGDPTMILLENAIEGEETICQECDDAT